MNKNIYSVGQINQYIKKMFSQDFMLRRISIKGEVSNCKYHQSRHIYFTLKDADGEIRAVMFAGNRGGLDFKMKDGDHVVVTGSIEVYEKSGTYQLYAKEIVLDGQGNLYQQYLERKRAYEEMGMFAQEYKQPIPEYAGRIGIVTAPTGAAIRDICNIAFRRNPHVKLILYPALVQGDGAAESVAHGISELTRIGVDVIIVGRGGGSIEDLWAFNEDAVARAIFDCPIPIISAVGHETDTTIADYVADLRAPTPSAAAELAVFDYAQTVREIEARRDRLLRLMNSYIIAAKRKNELYEAKIMTLSPQSRLNARRQYLADTEEKMNIRMVRMINDRRTALCSDKAKMKLRMEWLTTDRKHRLALLSGKLEGHSPLTWLSRGYAYVQDGQHRALKSAGQVKTGDILTVNLQDGRISAQVLDCTG
ncbi:MAG: exodeoxyribonuclease VII large subunit [Clostridiales bacterium]|nr:exodeoxyribonuclease VII large subunit [Clostridiales bacterium]